MKDLRQNIEGFVEPFLRTIDAFLIDVQIASVEQRKVIKLFVDTDKGITIGQCSELSRELGKALELQDFIPGSYVLEVSSPGLKQPLKLLRQYNKNIGRKFKVRFKKNDNVEEITAKLTGVENEILTFETGKKEIYAIQFNEIIESIEELPW